MKVKQFEGWLYECRTYDCNDLLLFDRQLTMQDIEKHAEERRREIEEAYDDCELLRTEELQELERDVMLQREKLVDGVLVCNCLRPCHIEGAKSILELFERFKGKRIRVRVEVEDR